MDLKLLEETVCKGFSQCLDCRNSRKKREEFFRNGYVDQIDFACPHGIPMSSEVQAAPVGSSPVVVSDESKRVQENMSKVPEAIRNLRRVVTGEAVEWLETIAKAFFPRGLRFGCVYQQKTKQMLKVRHWGTVARIYCCAPKYDSARLFLIEPECTPEKCPHYRETRPFEKEQNNHAR